MKTKLVNLRCSAAVRIDGVTYSGRVTNIELPIDTIRKCLLNRIRVEEVKPNGKTIPLGFDNYAIDTDNIPEKVNNVKKGKNNLPEFKVYSYDRKGNKITPPEYKEQIKATPKVGEKKEEPAKEAEVKPEEKTNTQQKYTKKH